MKPAFILGIDGLPYTLARRLIDQGVMPNLGQLARVGTFRRDLLLRVPAASVFFVLLALYARDDVMLIAYALAFVPPYLALTAGAAKESP